MTMNRPEAVSFGDVQIGDKLSFKTVVGLYAQHHSGWVVAKTTKTVTVEFLGTRFRLARSRWESREVKRFGEQP